MELRKEYKQTELGMLPIDWDVKRLGNCLSKKPEYGINAPATPFSDTLPTYIRITDITDEGRYIKDNCVSVKHPKSELYFLEEGDLVFARTGASVGKSYLYNKQDGRLVFAGFLIRVRPNKEYLNPKYLKYFSQTKMYWNWVAENSMRSGQPGVNGNQYSQLPIPLPNDINEQHAVSYVLADIDELIEGLEQLIAKKRAIKQGTMQELLTGKRRLKGFSGEWKEKKLGQLGVFTKGKGINKDFVLPNGLPCIRYGEIYTHHNEYIKEFYSFVSAEVARESQKIRKGDLIFAGSGETAEEIGKCVAYLDDKEAYAGGDTIIFSPYNEDSKYLGFLLNSANIVRQKAQMAQGDAVVHIYPRNLATINLNLPSTKDEQSAISQIISNIDEDVGLLERQLCKYRLIKQGMMQELLTGKTRLV